MEFDNLTFEIRKLWLLIKREFETKAIRYTKQRPTRTQAAIIFYILQNREEGKDTYQKDIENSFSIRASTVTNLLQGMEKNGYIERIPNAQDARLKKIVFTQKTEDMQEALKSEMKIINDRINNSLTTEEQKTLIALIRKIQSQIDQN